MSVKIMSAVWENGPADSTQRFVLLALANYSNDEGSGAYPSFATIAKRCSISRRTAIRAVDSLIESGYLTRTRRANDKGLFTSSDYRINVVRLSGSSDTVSPYPSDKVTLGSDTMSPHSDTVSLGWCQDDTRGSDTVSPNPSFLSVNYPSREPSEERGVFPTPESSPQFQPVPETVKRQKARRGDKDPEPMLIAQAPAAVRLISKLTNTWPGADITDDLVQLFGETPNEAALTEAVRQWRLADHKITNYGGIADWYQELCRDPTWTPSKRFKGKSNPKYDPDAREAHNRAVLDQVSREINTGEWTPWITNSTQS